MKTLIKTGKIELIKNSRGIVLLQSCTVIDTFSENDLLTAIITVISIIKHNHRACNRSGTKLMANFQPDLFL